MLEEVIAVHRALDPAYEINSNESLPTVYLVLGYVQATRSWHYYCGKQLALAREAKPDQKGRQFRQKFCSKQAKVRSSLLGPGYTSMVVIEWLKIKVLPELREQYIQKDTEIWTAALVNTPGFLSKEVWIEPTQLSEVVIVIRWATREQWKSFPADHLALLEQQFAQAMPTGHKIVETGEYQIRKFAPLLGNS